MPALVGAIDSGTTSSRFMLFDPQGNVVAYDQREHRQIFPQSGWVEHDPLEIWERTRQVIGATLAKAQVTYADLAAVGITNQRETTIIWERATGKPIYNAIVWQDTRTDRICHELQSAGSYRSYPSQDRLAHCHLLLLAPKFAGCSTMCRVHARAPKRANCSLAR